MAELSRFCELYAARWPQDFRHAFDFESHRDGSVRSVRGLLTEYGAFDMNAKDHDNAQFINHCLDRLVELGLHPSLRTDEWGPVVEFGPLNDEPIYARGASRAEACFDALLQALELASPVAEPVKTLDDDTKTVTKQGDTVQKSNAKNQVT